MVIKIIIIIITIICVYPDVIHERKYTRGSPSAFMEFKVTHCAQRGRVYNYYAKLFF